MAVLPRAEYRKKRGKAYEASVRIDGKLHYIGRFVTEEEAAKAYDDYLDARNIRGPRNRMRTPEAVNG